MNEANHFNFKSDKKNNFFAPEWDAHIFEKKINHNNNLSKFLKNIKNKILKLPPTVKNNKYSDGYTGLGKNSTTARYTEYNILKFENIEVLNLKNEIIIFHNEINNFLGLKIPEKIYVNCWVNFLKKNEKINIHSHCHDGDCYLGGHYCVEVNDTKTIYVNPITVPDNDPLVYESNNVNGKLTIFSNFVPHYTTINKHIKERITLAFDISLKKTNENQLEILCNLNG